MIVDRFRKSLVPASLAATVAWAAALPAMAAGFANPQLAVSVSWLQQHMNDNGLIVVDARPADAYAKGHLPNAVSLPVTDTFDPDKKKNFPDTKAKLEAFFGSHGIGDSNQVVVYDNGKSVLDPGVLRPQACLRPRRRDRRLAGCGRRRGYRRRDAEGGDVPCQHRPGQDADPGNLRGRPWRPEEGRRRRPVAGGIPG